MGGVCCTNGWCTDSSIPTNTRAYFWKTMERHTVSQRSFQNYHIQGVIGLVADITDHVWDRRSFALFFLISQAESHSNKSLGIHMEVPDILSPDVGGQPIVKITLTTPTPHICKTYAPKICHTMGSVWHKSRLKPKNFYRKDGIRTQKIWHTTPPLLCHMSRFYWGWLWSLLGPEKVFPRIRLPKLLANFGWTSWCGFLLKPLISWRKGPICSRNSWEGVGRTLLLYWKTFSVGVVFNLLPLMLLSSS